MSKPIIIVVGPTASGKTDLSIAIAKRFNGECINSDSTQIYEGTDIATNKITFDEMEGIAHHLLSVRTVTESYSVAEFQMDARKIIQEIMDDNKTPIIVGGTGLYVNALIKNYFFPKFTKDLGYQEQFNDIDNQTLWNKLNNSNPDWAASIHPNNRQRVLRTLEIAEQISEIPEAPSGDNVFFYDNLIIVGLLPDRNMMYEKINARVLRLTEKGLFSEIESAWIANEYNASKPALRCIGGPEIISFLKNDMTYEEAIEKMQQHNRNYAKKQLTWWTKQLPETKWFEHTYDNFDEIVEKVLIYIENKLKSKEI